MVRILTELGFPPPTRQALLGSLVYPPARTRLIGRRSQSDRYSTGSEGLMSPKTTLEKPSNYISRQSLPAGGLAQKLQAATRSCGLFRANLPSLAPDPDFLCNAPAGRE
jgi:hypothetical protein